MDLTNKSILVFCFIVIINKFTSSQQTDAPDDLSDDVTVPLPPSSSILHTYEKAAVVTNGVKCAEMAKNILKKGGNAIDASITALLCEGISCPESMGLGGGFLMTYYERKSKQMITINAKEKAPSKATLDMYDGKPNASQNGPLASGVPGELRGYWEVYNKFGGKVPWKDLFTEVIELAKTGIPISSHLARNIKVEEKEIRANPELSQLFINEKNEPKTEKDFYVWPTLAKTLTIISEEGGNALHDGSLTKMFIKDIQDGGGIITEEDMNQYNIRIEKPITARLKDDFTIWTSPLPGSGIVLSFMLRVLQYLIPAPSELLWHQRLTETMKYAYAYRGFLGDNDPAVNNPSEKSINEIVNQLQNEDFINKIRSEISDNRTWQTVEHYNGKLQANEDHGTANIVVMSPEGDTVVVTSSINLQFGCRFISKSTGILLNNHMNDFSSPSIINFSKLPPSIPNFIQPNKRPISSMCPSIITDSFGNVRLAIGAAGGPKITTTLTQIILLNLYMNYTIKQSLDAARIHHQLSPMKYNYEHGVLRDIIEGMRHIGHVTKRLPDPFPSSVTAISIKNPCNKQSEITVNSDFRRLGGVAGF